MLVVNAAETCICGFEFDKADAEILANEESGEGLWVLGHIQRFGCAEIELDDSPHDGIDVLIKAVGEYWYHFATQCTHVFVEHKKFYVRR